MRERARDNYQKSQAVTIRKYNKKDSVVNETIIKGSFVTVK